MRAEKPIAVWVAREIAESKANLRKALGLLLGASLWTLAGPAGAQPLAAGIAGTDGRHFLLDDGAIKVFSKDFAELPAVKSGPVTTLYGGAEGWRDSFLALTAEGLARVSTADGGFQLVVPGEELTVLPWGSDFLAYSAKGKSITLLTPTGETALALPAELDSVEVVDARFALVQSSKGLNTLLRDATGGAPVIREVRLPFPLAETKVSVGQGRLYLWSYNSDTVWDMVDSAPAPEHPNNALYPEAGIPRKLPEKPIYGMNLIEGGYAATAGDRSVALLLPDGGIRSYPRPSVISEKAFTSWPMMVIDGNLIMLVDEKGRTRAIHYHLTDTPADMLPAGKFVSVVMPEPGKVGQPLMFWETSREEPKVDADGRQVLDPSSGKPVPPLAVRGHRIFVLERSGRWNPVVEDPRAMLVGPIERVGDRVIYATRSEPFHQQGVALEQDPRYPYPKVVLQGRSMSHVTDVWSFDQPRGMAPSKDRMPEEHWPMLSPTGPLLVTSEGAELLAIDPADGKLLWQSPELSIDESSPPMVQWPDAFALQAAKSTGRSLLVIDSKTGDLVNTITLTGVLIWEKWRHLLGVLVVCAALAYYIYAAGRRDLYIRKIAGLQALDEAVGRATEMGKPVLYVVGLADVDDIQTMASLSILSHVARKTAEYDTPIVTTTARAVAFSAAQEIVRDAFSVAGRPDAFSVESVRYISDDQFGYTAGVDGIMVREKPAANFYIGNFYAESLILAETGYATGSIQIAGTAQPSQVPFFVAACDYTLIGEELYAASAYISRDPMQVGSLRGQDVGKAIVMILLLLCSLLVSMGVDLAKISEWTGVNLP